MLWYPYLFSFLSSSLCASAMATRQDYYMGKPNDNLNSMETENNQPLINTGWTASTVTANIYYRCGKCSSNGFLRKMVTICTTRRFQVASMRWGDVSHQQDYVTGFNYREAIKLHESMGDRFYATAKVGVQQTVANNQYLLPRCTVFCFSFFFPGAKQL